MVPASGPDPFYFCHYLLHYRFSYWDKTGFEKYTHDDDARRIHGHGARSVQQLVGGGDDFREGALGVDGEADGGAALGKFGGGLVDVDVEVGLVEEGVGEGGAG